MNKIRLTGRSSRLSLLQIERVQSRLQEAYPGMEIEVLPRESRGDLLQDIPLQTVEGTDFFTADLYRALAEGEADIAIHSLKDMSAEHFFGDNYFAVIEREDTRDLAIFNSDIIQKISDGKTLVIGTCSPRREEMAIDFLTRALPALQYPVKIQVKPIRGNVDTRLRKLDAGEYDGTILATAGLNRLLSSDADGKFIRQLLTGKKLMVLPLIECVPAPCQGAIVAECLPANRLAVELLNHINNGDLMSDCIREKEAASAYGTGCIQKFGVTSFTLGNRKYGYAAGKDQHDQAISQWTGLPDPTMLKLGVFSSTDHMSDFFSIQYAGENVQIDTPVVFVANYKAIQQDHLIQAIKNKRVWASGTKTWFDLARKGIWVEGSADALGLESLLPAFTMPVMDIQKKDVTVITHLSAAMHWRDKGWHSVSTYSLAGKKQPLLTQAIQRAGLIFWTSFGQYDLYKKDILPGTIHASPYGETSERLKQAGIDPVIFPTLKSFQAWRSSVTP